MNIFKFNKKKVIYNNVDNSDQDYNICIKENCYKYIIIKLGVNKFFVSKLIKLGFSSFEIINELLLLYNDNDNDNNDNNYNNNFIMNSILYFGEPYKSINTDDYFLRTAIQTNNIKELFQIPNNTKIVNKPLNFKQFVDTFKYADDMTLYLVFELNVVPICPHYLMDLIKQTMDLSLSPNNTNKKIIKIINNIIDKINPNILFSAYYIENNHKYDMQNILDNIFFNIISNCNKPKFFNWFINMYKNFILNNYILYNNKYSKKYTDDYWLKIEKKYGITKPGFGRFIY